MYLKEISVLLQPTMPLCAYRVNSSILMSSNNQCILHVSPVVPKICFIDVCVCVF